MNLIIIHGEVFNVNKKDFLLTKSVQVIDNTLNDEEYYKILMNYHNYIRSKYKVIQINPPTLMY